MSLLYLLQRFWSTCYRTFQKFDFRRQKRNGTMIRRLNIMKIFIIERERVLMWAVTSMITITLI